MDPIIDCYLMISEATHVVERMVVGHAEREGYRFVLIDETNSSVGLGWMQTASGWTPTLSVDVAVEPESPPITETVADLLAQIEALKAKVEALEPAVVP